MTRKLFWEDPYMKEFDAKVVSINDKALVLDQTCFYPQGGGQVGDTGAISELRVADTQKNEEFTVMHMLEVPTSLKEGDAVHGKIDWERRHRIMRLHSAAHVVQFLVQELFGQGLKPLSSGLVDDRKDRVDWPFEEKLDLMKLAEVERQANEIIMKGAEIRTWSKETDPNHRYWQIPRFPPMDCGGTHPHNVNEIGRIKVSRGKKPGAGKERIETSLAEVAH